MKTTILLVLSFASLVAPRLPGAAGAQTTTLAGTGVPGFSGDGGAASEAQINNPFGVELGPDGDIYFCDTGNHAIGKIDRQTGVITTIAGTDSPGLAREESGACAPAGRPAGGAASGRGAATRFGSGSAGGSRRLRSMVTSPLAVVRLMPLQ